MWLFQNVLSFFCGIVSCFQAYHSTGSCSLAGSSKYKKSQSHKSDNMPPTALANCWLVLYFCFWLVFDQLRPANFQTEQRNYSINKAWEKYGHTMLKIKRLALASYTSTYNFWSYSCVLYKNMWSWTHWLLTLYTPSSKNLIKVWRFWMEHIS